MKTDYESAIEYIYSRRKFAKSNGLERMEALLAELGNPQTKLKFVHVVGTNGKGSVSTMISSAVTSAGYKTGLFTSPFVTEFRERIQIDKKYIDKAEFCRITQKVKEKIEIIEKQGLSPTFFETVLAVALCFFAESGCELAVLEAGIGGKDDSTNIIPPPLVSVITSISLDHTEVLGKTIEEIAASKCGIIKKGSTIVSFPKENAGLDFVSQTKQAAGIIEERCRQTGCRLIFPDVSKVHGITQTLYGTDFTFDEKQYHIGFTGDHQIANALVSICAINSLAESGFSMSDEQIRQGLSEAFIPARMEIIGSDRLTIIDGGHNEGCMAALAKMIKKHLPNKKITAVLGFMQDKDNASSLKIIAPLCENIVFTLADKARGETPESLAKKAVGHCDSIYTESDIARAYEKAKTLCKEDDVLVCAGSFYMVSEIRRLAAK